jgi:hypothetical protein
MSTAPHPTDEEAPGADPVPGLLALAHACLDRACAADRVGERYAQASRAAAQAAAVLLTRRTGRPVTDTGSLPNRRVLWSLLGDVLPELGEWAEYFSATDRLALGGGPFGARAADDLVRAAEQFIVRVEAHLGRSAVVAGVGVSDRLRPAH